MKSVGEVILTTGQANHVRLALHAAEAYLPGFPFGVANHCLRCKGPVDKALYCRECAAAMVREALELMQQADPEFMADLAAFRASRDKGGVMVWPIR